jgi:hypothetical protein
MSDDTEGRAKRPAERAQSIKTWVIVSWRRMDAVFVHVKT